MTQQIFRRADITGPATAVEIPTVACNGGGGIQSLESMLRQVEGMEGTITRFLELFEKFSKFKKILSEITETNKYHVFSPLAENCRPFFREGAIEFHSHNTHLHPHATNFVSQPISLGA